jgi:hypothetical protein
MVPFDLIDAGTSGTTVELVVAVVAGDVLEGAVDVWVAVVCELLPHAAIAPMHRATLGATNQFLQLRNSPSPLPETESGRIVPSGHIGHSANGSPPVP